VLYVEVADGHVGALCHRSPDNAQTITIFDVPAKGFAFPKGAVVVDEALSSCGPAAIVFSITFLLNSLSWPLETKL